MASNVSDYVQDKIVKWVNGTTFVAAPANTYVALYTVAPTNAGTGGTECAGTGYARVAIAAGGWTESGTDPTQIVNAALVNFGSAGGANWGTLVAYAVLDAASGGNQLWTVGLAVNKLINNGDPVSFPAGALIWQVGA